MSGTGNVIECLSSVKTRSPLATTREVPMPGGSVYYLVSPAGCLGEGPPGIGAPFASGGEDHGPSRGVEDIHQRSLFVRSTLPMPRYQ